MLVFVIDVTAAVGAAFTVTAVAPEVHPDPFLTVTL